MVNRGDGGSRRPAPPARPAARPPARPGPADDSEEKTGAINLADVNLDELDEVPSRPQPPPRNKGGLKDFDDGNEPTNAFNLADVNLDDVDDVPSRPQPPARPQPASRPQPQAAAPRAPAKPAAPPPRAAPAPAEEEEEKTSAINLQDINKGDVVAQARAKLAAARGHAAPAPTPAPRTAPAKAPEVAAPAPRPRTEPKEAPAPRPAPAKPAEPVIEKTMAVSLDDIESARPAALAKLKAMKSGKSEPAAADKTFLVDEEEVPVVKAPEAKRLPAALRGAQEAAAPAASAPAAPARGGSGVVEPEPKLAIVAGPDKGKVYPLTKDLTLVGRGVDADCVINDASASRKHFNIVRTLNGWKLVDLGSGNGTRVDGNRVSEISLQPGMKIEAGGTTLEWRMEVPPSSQAKKEAAAPAAAVRPPTLSPGLGGDEPPSRRAQAEPARGGAGDRKRDPSRLDRLADLDDDKPKSKPPMKSAADDEVVEKTTFGDIAALEIDPEWEARRLKQRKDGVSGKADEIVAKSAKVLEEEVEEAPKKGGAGKKIAIAAVVVGVLGGGFVAADKFAGLGIIFPKAASVEKPKDPVKEPEKADNPPKEPVKEPVKEAVDPEPGKEPVKEAGAADGADKGKDAKALVQKGDEHAKEKRFIAAARAYKAATEIDEAVDGGLEGLANVEKQVQSLTPVIESLEFIDSRAFFDLHEKLKTVPDFSAYKPLAEQIAADAQEDVLVDLLAKVAETFTKGDFKAAKPILEDALTIAGPDYAEGARLKDVLERGLAADANKRDSDPAQDGTPTDFKAGFEAYGKGEFSTAADKFAGAEFESAVTKVDVGKSRLYAAAVIITEEQLKFAASLENKPEEALPAVRSVRRADALLGFGQRAAVDKLYANVAGVMAKKAVEDGQLELASLKARVALAINPAQADAKAALAKASEAGKAALGEAKAALEAEPDKAAVLVVKALRLLGKDDAERAEAKKLAESLAKP